MSQTPLAAASASSPGVLNGTYFTGTPSRVATSRARSGATPSGSPAGLFPVTSRKFERLIAARNTPVGASSEITSGDMGKLAPINGGGEGSRTLRRLLGFCGNADQRAQNAGGAFQSLFRLLPFVEEHDLHVGANARAFGVLRDKRNQP